MTPDPSLPAAPFHRMAALRPAWAGRLRPPLTLLAAFIAYVVLISVVLVLTILVLALAPGVNVALGVTSGDPTSALDVTLALAMGAMWLPAGIIGVRFGGWRPLGTAWSVTARWRRPLLRSLGPWGVAMGALVVAAAALAGAVTGADGGGAADSGASVPQLLLVGAVVLVLGPLQVIGLELTLRGAVMQALGSWLRRPLPSMLAASAVMLIGRALSAAVVLPALALGLASAVLDGKSGGLELAILLVPTGTGAFQLVSASAPSPAPVPYCPCPGPCWPWTGTDLAPEAVGPGSVPAVALLAGQRELGQGRGRAAGPGLDCRGRACRRRGRAGPGLPSRAGSGDRGRARRVRSCPCRQTSLSPHRSCCSRCASASSNRTWGCGRSTCTASATRTSSTASSRT